MSDWNLLLELLEIIIRIIDILEAAEDIRRRGLPRKITRVLARLTGRRKPHGNTMHD